MRTATDDGVTVSKRSRNEWTWQHAVDKKGHEFQALIIDFKHHKVLLQREEERWILPGCVLHWSKYESSTDPTYLHAVVKHLTDWAWNFIFLRVAWRDEKEVRIDGMNLAIERLTAVFEFIADLPVQSERYQWVGLSDSDVYHQVHEARAAIKREIQCAIKGSGPKNRFSWERSGWYMYAAEWMVKVLESQCCTSLIEPLVYEHSSHLGAILQAKTAQGTFFLRCYPAIMNDASCTKVLSKIVPDHVLEPVATDEHRQLMMTRDHGEALVAFSLLADVKKRLTTNFAQLQKKVITKCDELVAAGFPDFRLNVIRDELDRVITNSTFLILEERHAWTPATEQFRFYRENLGLFKESLELLEESLIPPTVTHNNLGFSNVFESEDSDSYIFEDWVDGFVSHPFVSNTFGLDKNQYLQEWRQYGTLEQLRRWLKVGQSFHSFVRFLLRLREAAAWEEPATRQSMKEALNELSAFNQNLGKP